AGVNSYGKDLGFDPLEWLRRRTATSGEASWLDLCCGSGRALIQAARQQVDGLRLVGVDLVDYFDGAEDLPNLTLVTASVVTFEPGRTFDLITCVHGLHYVGDKLAVLARAVSWLAPGGLFASHLDLGNIKAGDSSATTALKRLMAAQRIDYNARR